MKKEMFPYANPSQYKMAHPNIFVEIPWKHQYLKNLEVKAKEGVAVIEVSG